MPDPEHLMGHEHEKEDKESKGSEAYWDQKEEDIWSGTYSGKSMLGTWVLAGFLTTLAVVGTFLLRANVESIGADNYFTWLILLLLIVLFWGVPMCKLAYKKMSLSYTLTNKKLIHREGFLKRTEDEIRLIDVDDISIEQSLFERMMGVGSIVIVSTDVSHPKLAVEGIANVQDVKKQFDEVYHRARKEVMHHRDY